MRSRTIMMTALAAALLCLPVCGEATVYYIGGEAPTGKESYWLAGSWTNLNTQIQKLASGDELRIAACTIERTETGWPSQAVHTANISLKGAWQTTGGTWTRLSLTNRSNYSVIDNNGALGTDGDRRSPCLIIEPAATNVFVEGLWLKRGNSRNSPVPYLGGGLLVMGHSAKVDYCCMTGGDCPGSSSDSVGLAVTSNGYNTVVRRCWFADNKLSYAQGIYSGANLYVAGAEGVRITECEFYEGASTNGRSVTLSPPAGRVCTLDNCVVYDSRGICFSAGTSEVINVTFHTAALGLYNNNPRAHLRNCIISESPEWTMDTGATADGYVYVYDSLVDDLGSRTNKQFGTSWLHWLYIDTNPAGSVTNLDIDAGHDPAFEDVAHSNFTLKATSAALELGRTNCLWSTYQGAVLGLNPALQTDLAGALRVQGQRGGFPDAGAYEFPFVPKGMVLVIR